VVLDPTSHGESTTEAHAPRHNVNVVGLVVPTAIGATKPKYVPWLEDQVTRQCEGAKPLLLREVIPKTVGKFLRLLACQVRPDEGELLRLTLGDATTGKLVRVEDGEALLLLRA